MRAIMRNTVLTYFVLISAALAASSCRTDRVPDAPQVFATAASAQVTLTCDTPDHGEGEIVDYKIEYKLSASGSYSTFSDGVSTVCGGTVTGITNGSAYDFRISALNKYGYSLPSTVVSATPSAGVVEPYSLAGWLYLRTAQDTDLDDEPDDIYQPDLLTFSSDEFVRGSTFEFLTPQDGVIGGTSTSPRTELRGQNIAWDAVTEMRLKFSPEDFPNGDKSIVLQAHEDVITGLTFRYNQEAASAGYLKVHYYESEAGAQVSAFIKEGMDNEDVTDMRVRRYPDRVEVYVDGNVNGTVPDWSSDYAGETRFTRDGTNADFHWSMGNYYVTRTNGSTTKIVHHTGTYSNPIVVEVPDAPSGLEATQSTDSVNLLWFEPDANGHAITDYRIQYKLSTDADWTTYADGVSTDEAVSVPDLTAGFSYDFRVAGINSEGAGVYSAVVTETPTGDAGGLEDVLTGVVACWNGNDYDGSGDWENSVASPADGSAQADYDITPSGGAMWVGGIWTFDGTNTFDLGTNTNFVKSLGKTTAGNDWTVLAKVKTATGTPQSTTLGTADVSGNYGVVMRVDSGGALKFDQYNGTSLVTQSRTGTALAAATKYTLGIKYDYDSNTIGFAANSDTWGTKSANWTAGVTSDPTYSLKIGSEGNGGSRVANWNLYGLCLIDHDLSDAELVTANDWFDAEFPDAAAVAPGKVYSIAKMPSNGGVYLAWDVQQPDADHDKTGGSPITDYTIQYKLSSSGSWSTFADGTSSAINTKVTGITNGTQYDFRIAAVNAIGTGNYSDVVSATPQAEGTNPYDETDWKLTLPVNIFGNRANENILGVDYKATEITSGIATYESAWFGRVGDEFWFNCTYPGATTATAVYSRSELRGLTGGLEFNHNQDAEHTLKFKVTQCPTDVGNTKVITHQIHNADIPLIKFNYDCRAGTGQDRLRGLMKIHDADPVDCDFNGDGTGETCPTFKSGITRGDWITSRIVWDGDGSDHGGQQSMDIYIDGVLFDTYEFFITGAEDPHYFKAGNYCQLGPAGSMTTVVHGAP